MKKPSPLHRYRFPPATAPLERKLAIIAGSGRYPVLFARSAKEKVQELIVIAVDGMAARDIEGIAERTYWVGAGELRKLVGIFLKERPGQVAMVGKITKDILHRASAGLDDDAKRFLAGVSDKRGDTILKAFADKIESFGIEVIDSTTFVGEFMAKEGVYTKRPPAEKEWEDIRFGGDMARRLASLSIGQTVVVKDKDIVAVEAIEGTDEAIRRGASLAGEGIVVVKMSRPEQDMRFDMPIIGADTVALIAEVKGSALAIEKDRALFFDRNEAIDIADKNDIAIAAV